jgi:hypothetical protein
VLQGCGREELLKVMDYDVLPHFNRHEGSGSSKHNNGKTIDCFCPDHPLHVELYNYIKQQAVILKPVAPTKMGSFQVDVTIRLVMGALPFTRCSSVVVQNVETVRERVHRVSVTFTACSNEARLQGHIH